MTEVYPSFFEHIQANKGAEVVPNSTTTIENPDGSLLTVRFRGCFITNCALTDKLSGNKINILYSDPDLSVGKLTASHIMSPVGPSEGIGGQHGFPRWANYQEFPQIDGPNGEKRVAFQAKRSDFGLGISKVFELGRNYLETETIIFNSEEETAKTSLGEHLYFALEDEKSTGLRVNGQSLDELLGKGTEAAIMAGEPCYWPLFDGAAKIDFPAGYSIQLAAEVSGGQQDKLGMLIWHRPGSASICFEPTAGFNPENDNCQLSIEQGETATLTTRIELLNDSVNL
ncbi:hypothetical protein H7X68_01050 [Candidatus Saccharibacteria bacterium]|nr:hypothetical protein [Candidatus Saccharibacteria bacterium]